MPRARSEIVCLHDASACFWQGLVELSGYPNAYRRLFDRFDREATLLAFSAGSRRLAYATFEPSLCSNRMGPAPRPG